MPLGFKIKNIYLALLALFFICLFVYLGMWQLHRAQQKRALLHTYAQRSVAPPLSAKDLSSLEDKRFYRAKLIGYYDNNHTLLLDNKITNGQVGYEIYTPFKAEGIKTAFLIDRGFIAGGFDRKILPLIKPLPGKATLIGMLNLPPTYVALGKMHEKKPTWPLRVEFINIAQLSALLGYALSPDVIALMPKDQAAFKIEWQIVTMPPERHTAYAIQWFALALTLLILFVALNRDRKKKK